MKAQNIFLDENTGGKGRYFKARFLQPGLVKYSFGVCVLSKETIDKFVQNYVGCPVIINHKDVTNESAKKDRVGVISRVWFDNSDGWYWCEGVIFDEKAISLIESGYNVSCQYEITEYSNNTTGALHNGNPYDKVILNGKPEHLAIVETPRYENAMIAVNALDLTEQEEPKPKEYLKQAINEIKETNMFKNLFNKKEQKMDKDELKSIFMDCIQDVLKAQNAEDEKPEDADDKDKADNKCKNGDVDKRELIRKIAAIAGKEEDSEDVRTIIKLAEQLGYNKSEAGTADNGGKKGKNEEEPEKDDKDKEKEKEEAANKAKNSIEMIKGLLSQGTVQKPASKYMTKAQAIELGNELF